MLKYVVASDLSSRSQTTRWTPHNLLLYLIEGTYKITQGVINPHTPLQTE